MKYKNRYVAIECYNDITTMDLISAKNKFLESMTFSEGHEQARYVAIYTQLLYIEQHSDKELYREKWAFYGNCPLATDKDA